MIEEGKRDVPTKSEQEYKKTAEVCNIIGKSKAYISDCLEAISVSEDIQIIGAAKPEEEHVASASS